MIVESENNSVRFERCEACPMQNWDFCSRFAENMEGLCPNKSAFVLDKWMESGHKPEITEGFFQKMEIKIVYRPS